MVRIPVPDDEYQYGVTDYWATFELRITDPPPEIDDTVVTIEIFCLDHSEVLSYSLVKVSDFGSADTLDRVLTFSLAPCTITCGSNEMPLITGGAFDQYADADCDNVDLRVYWYDKVTTYLDKVVVEDQRGKDLFDGAKDDSIKTDAKSIYSTYSSLHERFYLVDEPFISSYLPFQRVSSLISDTLNGIERARSLTATYHDFERFLLDASPSKLMIDPYFLTSNMPHPSLDDSTAFANGIDTVNSNYLLKLQDSIDSFIARYHKVAAEASSNPVYDVQQILIPQLHGFLFAETGKYRWPDSSHTLRPPSPSELKLQYGLGIAYGAKGVLPFPYYTHRNGVVTSLGDTVTFPGLVSWKISTNGFLDDHWSNYVTMPSSSPWFGLRAWSGYSEKWDVVANLNQTLAEIGSTLQALEWIGAKSWNTGLTAGDGTTVVTSCSTRSVLGSLDQTAFVEIGYLDDDQGTDYLVVVNRRCDNQDTRDIELVLNSQPTNLLISDLTSDRSWVTKGSSSFTDRFDPGEWKVYKLESATLSGTRSFASLEFRNGAKMTLTPGATVTAGGDLDTARVVLAGYSTFKADTGCTMIVIDDTSFVLGSNSTLEIHGTATISASDSWYIPAGATMNVFGTGTLKFGSGASLVIKGTLEVDGTSAQLATFTRSGTSSWNGITIRNGSQPPTASLSYAKVQYCATALDIGTNTVLEIDNCILSNSTYGIVFTTSGLSTGTQRTISNSTIQDVVNGVVFNSFSTVLLDNNTITRSTIPTDDVATGIRCFSSSPKVLGTTVQAGGGGGAFVRGVACLNASSPVFEDGAVGGYNRIRNNGTGVYCSSKSKPVLGIKSNSQDEGGKNSVYGNTTYDVLLGDSSKSKAESNWWGENPPDTTDFSITGGSTFDYTPYETVDPNPGARMGGSYLLATSKGAIDGGGGGSMNPGNVPRELQDALMFRSDGRYGEAIAVLESVIGSSRMPVWVKDWAVTELLASAQNFENSSISTFLESAGGSYPDLSRTIDLVMPHVYLDEGMTSEAMARFDENISGYPSSELERDGLYGRFLNALYTDEDTSAARTWLSTLSVRYPESDEALVADHLIETYIATMSRPGTEGEQIGRGATALSNVVALPREFILAQNYPNPFNPTTIIQYALPVDSRVTLKIYDILGREVRTMIDEFKEIGYHQVTMDVSNLATGVYFYRLTAGSFTDVKKLVVVK